MNVTTEEKQESFSDLGVIDKIVRLLEKKGFEKPSSIQQKTIPFLLNEDKDLVGQAQTGTGKTAAYGLPLIQHLQDTPRVKDAAIKALVLVPTRELAIQVTEELNSFNPNHSLHIISVYGGQSIEQQIRRLRNADIVIGTPGRIMDHLQRKSLKLDEVSYVILDEADEMLAMGFIEDIEEILSYTSDQKRMFMFSATMPQKILKLAQKYMKEYDTIKIENKTMTADLTSQIYFEVNDADKFEALCRIIDMEEDFYAFVFCRTKVETDSIARKLIDRGYEAEGLHGDLSQSQRERTIRRFRDRQINILVATDVAARGIDIQDLTHVINYSLPQDPESYVHRIGRTGRAGKEGTAITFVTPEEYRRLGFIRHITKSDIRRKQLPEVQEVISIKKQRIFNDLAETIQQEKPDNFNEIADELLTRHDPRDVVAGLLKMAFETELDERFYREIKAKTSKELVNKAGKARLFVALGREDGMGPKELVNFFIKETGVETHKIKDVRVMANFSFITVPFEDAEVILEIFRRKKQGRRALVTKARAKDN